MKIKTILFSSLLFLISHYMCVKAMIFSPKKHRLDDVGQQIYEKHSGSNKSMFEAPPELFVLIPYKATFVEFLQKSKTPSQSHNSDQPTKENNLFLRIENK